MNPLLTTDFYKIGHVNQYPEGTELVYSNLTPRKSLIKGVNEIVVFGVAETVIDLQKFFDRNFFARPLEEVISEYKEVISQTLGESNANTAHIEELWNYRKLPLEFLALPEGTIAPIGTPILTFWNTHSQFYWVTNFVETMLSAMVWHGITSATIAREYRRMLTKAAKRTSDMLDFVDYQAHDFSMRGHTNIASAQISGAGHLLSFKGTDTIPAILLLKQMDSTGSLSYADIGGSVPATEHSVMCMGGMETEEQTFERLLTKVYPSGILSVVSDTWDLWNVLTVTLPKLKDVIKNRDGKLVIRPDSGDPVKILCGDDEAPIGSPAYEGVISLLYKTFGGEVNSKGYIQLDSHIGTIYGDSITLERCSKICELLEKKGFASTNVVFGIGSFTYQYVTRDTFGFAVKSTYGIINGKGVDIFKNPVTDNGTKKSRKGLLKVNNDFSVTEGVSWNETFKGLLKPIESKFDLKKIRQKVQSFAELEDV
jgi:nicotinamide phosphoribosyltransferase